MVQQNDVKFSQNGLSESSFLIFEMLEIFEALYRRSKEFTSLNLKPYHGSRFRTALGVKNGMSRLHCSQSLLLGCLAAGSQVSSEFADVPL